MFYGLCKFKYCKRDLRNLFVKHRCTLSIISISWTVQGDQITELNSNNGLTSTLKARTSKPVLRETKHRWISEACLWALAVMSHIWSDGDR